jgi:uncharacterized protein YbjT (DUF2867 family)
MREKILVVGGTGILGSNVTRRLLAGGREVRLLARPGSDYAPLVAAGAEAVMADLRDPETLASAFEGVGRVLTTANSAMRGGEDNVQSVDIDGNRNLIDAARRADVEQFVFVSALGASLDSQSPFMRAKAMTEEYLRCSGVPWTILAPNAFMEGWIGMIVGLPVETGRPVRLVGEGVRRHTFVSMEDVAALAVAALGDEAALNQWIPVAGPIATSWTEIVDACGQALGRPLEVERLQPGEPLPGLPAEVGELMAAMETYDSEVEMGEVARRFGIVLTPVEAFVRRTFGPRPDPD